MSQRQIGISFAYTITVFVSALLLFIIQPMSSKLVLPLLGGSSAVWTTSMLFFQIILLVGYIYAHGIAQYFSFPVQVVLHTAVVGTAMLFLPVSIPDHLLNPDGAPALSLVAALTMGIGPPTFVVSSSAPLLQHWFGGLHHPDADDPYYLYASSNAGSLLALLSYPFVVERFLTLDTQQAAWTGGFLLLALLLLACGVVVYTRSRTSSPDQSNRTASSLSLSRRGWWILITFLPSSLMLGVTHYLTTDIASVPLLWVLPLALYLLSFILVFARIEHPLWLYRMIIPAATFVVLALTFREMLSIEFVILMHTALFFLVALYFHGRLARDRPDVVHLTEYYIFMAFGGSLGGVFNALIAPMLFDQLTEYFLVLSLVLICALRRTNDLPPDGRFTKWMPHGLTAVACVYFFISTPLYTPELSFVLITLVGTLSVLVLAAVLVYMQSAIQVLLGLLLFAGFILHEDRSGTIARERSFFGQYEVRKETGNIRTFRHGTTMHGKQRMKGGQLLDIPTGYYHPMGPFGDLFRHIPVDKVGIAGLGTGGLAPYRQEGDEFQFFEIDPVVERLARQYFGYLDACGKQCRVEIGDARRLIREKSPKSFDLLVMDAYTSDAIPTHLLTKEAIQLYLSRVREGGVVALHISNRHFDLERVIGAIADELGVAVRVKTFVPEAEDPMSFAPNLYDLDIVEGGSKRFPAADIASASSVVLAVIAREEETLEPFPEEDDWEAPSGKPLLWTDNYTNIVPLLLSE